MNTRGLIIVGLISFCVIAGRGSFLLYSASEGARLDQQQRLISYDINHPSVKIRYINDTLFLEGLVENNGEKIRAEQIALAHISKKGFFRKETKLVNAISISNDRAPAAVEVAADYD